MKAAVMYGPSDIRYEDVETPSCEKDGFLIKVRAIGLCGSDIRNLTSDSAPGQYPKVYGHEIVGEIVEVGVECSGDYSVGEHVYVYPGNPCMKCRWCRSGHQEMCTSGVSYTDRMGGFADYYSVTSHQIASHSIYKLEEGQDLVAATLAEPLSSVYACQDNIDVRYGDTVVIIGAGPIGCFHIQLARMRGATKIILCELNETRLDLARRFGADYYICSGKEDAVEKVLEYTNGEGADKVISATPTTFTQNQAIYMAKPCGTVVWFGGVPKGKMAEIDSNVVHYRGLWIYGHYGSNSLQVEDSFHLALSPAFEAPKFVTHVLPLSQINDGIALTKSGEAIKVVLVPNEEEPEGKELLRWEETNGWKGEA